MLSSRGRTGQRVQLHPPEVGVCRGLEAISKHVRPRIQYGAGSEPVEGQFGTKPDSLYNPNSAANSSKSRPSPASNCFTARRNDSIASVSLTISSVSMRPS